jgi:hypothetical protein
MDECEWTGVDCDDNGRGDGFLASANVRGQIPDNLDLLTALMTNKNCGLRGYWILLGPESHPVVLHLIASNANDDHGDKSVRMKWR